LEGGGHPQQGVPDGGWPSRATSGTSWRPAAASGVRAFAQHAMINRLGFHLACDPGDVPECGNVETATSRSGVTLERMREREKEARERLRTVVDEARKEGKAQLERQIEKIIKYVGADRIPPPCTLASWHLHLHEMTRACLDPLAKILV
jgi:hypothetical protein